MTRLAVQVLFRWASCIACYWRWKKLTLNWKFGEKLYLNTYHPVMRKIIEDKLNKGNEHYIRKLTLIQDSIYGVDIQPIAVEISKLRCFLSLVVDELVFDNEDNRGIEPLPNLEFKFVAANSLVRSAESRQPKCLWYYRYGK